MSAELLRALPPDTEDRLTRAQMAASCRFVVRAAASAGPREIILHVLNLREKQNSLRSITSGGQHVQHAHVTCGPRPPKP